MRLSKIKLAGFKSFVDPTTIDFRSNLTGIVGPNGCGKSNTIDAVRWVMGESSAKYLRGESMDDVIFNGSSVRKPIGQASVELIFDNSDHTLGGEYAQFNEISIKRLVTRDGQSKYFLNGSKCRRRDITDIFLGTGLGPRSYAIIEQGMISRLIEAKPEELRTYLEEAAGISKYRQRRRETETRIRHTRENLDRLMDLREEVDKHLKQLERQAKAAEKYTTLRAEQRRTEAELLVFKLKSYKESISQQEIDIGFLGNNQQSSLTDIRAVENQIEQKRAAYHEAQETVNHIQEQYYKVQSEISTIESTIKHHLELKQRLDKQLSQVEQDIAIQQRHFDEDSHHIEQIAAELEVADKRLEELDFEYDAALELLDIAEEKLTTSKLQFEEIQAALAEPTQTAQIERARMEQLEKQQEQLETRKNDLSLKLETLAEENHQQEHDDLETQYTVLHSDHLLKQSLIDESKETVLNLEQKVQADQKTLSEYRNQYQSLTGRISSLKALQQAETGRDNKKRIQWLQKLGLDQEALLPSSIRVLPGWENAVETVLGDMGLMNAVAIKDINQFSRVIDKSQALVQQKQSQFGVTLFCLQTDAILNSIQFHNDFHCPILSNITGLTPLHTLIKRPENVKPLLYSYYACEDLDQARELISELPLAATIVTKKGELLGHNLLKICSDNPDEQGVLQRQVELDRLTKEQATLTQEIDTLEAKINENNQLLLESKQADKTLQRDISTIAAQLNQINNQKSVLQSKIEHVEDKKIQLTEALEQTVEQASMLNEEYQQASESRELSLEKLDHLSDESESIKHEKDQQEQEYSEYKQKTDQLTQEKQTLSWKSETLHTQQKDASRQIERSESQLTQLNEQKHQLLSQAEIKSDPTDTLDQELNEKLELSNLTGKELEQSRTQQQAIDAELREAEKQRLVYEQSLETVRGRLEAMKLDWRETKVHEETLSKQLAETDYDYTSLVEQLDPEIKVQDYERTIGQLKDKVKRLGAINLAAVDEYTTESERKAYLDEQYADLTEALETLESAIRKIDKETRSRFKDTFDQVNARVKDMFPRLFGGGEAFLEMTSDDLLTTGIVIMARPPGKRISSIHLMSGGEKALTAATLVFAIFELNPAPFCMLDEVDAPLDEANVGRFCRLVEHLSERVQFIFITHNRTTMELAEHLIGVTMREMGVSKIVSVDVAEATEMTQS